MDLFQEGFVFFGVPGSSALVKHDGKRGLCFSVLQGASDTVIHDGA